MSYTPQTLISDDPIEIEKPESTVAFSFSDEEDEPVFLEGKEKYFQHRVKERNSALINAAKMKHYSRDPMLRCQACGLSFIEQCGPLGMGFIEAHHILPLHMLTEETETKIEDIALVCSNCHRMLHRQPQYISKIDE